MDDHDLLSNFSVENDDLWGSSSDFDIEENGLEYEGQPGTGQT